MPELDNRLEALFARLETSTVPPPAPEALVERAIASTHREASIRPRPGRRRLWVIALAVTAIVIVGASIAAAGGLLTFRDPHASETTFPNEITCKRGAHLCTAGRSAGGRVFRLFKVGVSAADVQVVGAGVDTGDGKQVTPLICTAAVNGVQCGSQPPGGEKQLALYLPG